MGQVRRRFKEDERKMVGEEEVEKGNLRQWNRVKQLTSQGHKLLTHFLATCSYVTSTTNQNYEYMYVCLDYSVLTSIESSPIFDSTCMLFVL